MVRLNFTTKPPFQHTSLGIVVLLVFCLGVLWAILINHLSIEWMIDPQYGYGWAVPFLCAFLIWKRIQNSVVFNHTFAVWHPSCLLFFFALLYAPTRLVEKANSDWRLVSWALAIEVVGLTLLLIYLFLGPQWMRRLAVPIMYFLVAVPWPTFVETQLIQGLTAADTGATVELLGWLGVPAIQHGSVIEVATGEVGIDEACSGIRSFQATLMASLFLGELYKLNFPRRLILVFGGFTMSFLFNQVRMTILVWAAAHHGIAALTKWHDPAGFSILIACFFALWGLVFFLARKKVLVQPPPTASSLADFHQPKNQLIPLILSLMTWIVVVEISVNAWYRWHEMHLPAKAQWTMLWPTNNPTFREIQLDKKTQQILRCDYIRDASWQESDFQWEAILIKWNPGTPAQMGHTPDACMAATGHSLITISKCEWFDVGGFHLPFRVYEAVDAPRPYFVFFCIWNDVFIQQGFVSTLPTPTTGDRLALVRAGLRSVGHRSLEISLSGNLSQPQAVVVLQQQLQELVHVQQPGEDLTKIH